MDRKCCRDCRYCHALKELVDKKWVVRSCCTYWAETEPEGGYTSWVQVVDEYRDMCECYKPGEEAIKKLVTGGIEDVIAKIKDLTQKHSIVCSPIVRKVLEDAIPKSFGNVLIFDTPLLNGVDSIYVFDGDITEPRSWLPKEGLMPFDY